MTGIGPQSECSLYKRLKYINTCLRHARYVSSFLSLVVNENNFLVLVSRIRKNVLYPSIETGDTGTSSRLRISPGRSLESSSS